MVSLLVVLLQELLDFWLGYISIYFNQLECS